MKRSTICMTCLLVVGALAGCALPPTAPINATAAVTPTPMVVTAPVSISMVRGMSRASDAVGDVRDGNHQKPVGKLPGVDLIDARLDAHEQVLRVTFTSSMDFSKEIVPTESAIWSAHACSPDGARCCQIIGAEWVTFIFDHSGNVYAGSSVIKGRDLTITFPRDKLPIWMHFPFTWSATSEWGGRWKDRIPNESGDILNPPTVPFPKP